jgi:hypothetical protein
MCVCVQVVEKDWKEEKKCLANTQADRQTDRQAGSKGVEEGR